MQSVEVKIASPPYIEGGEQWRLLNAAGLIRQKVFVEGQGVDPAIERDGLDEELSHILLFVDEKACGCLRIHLLDEETVKLERIAVLKEFRNLGFGKRLVREALTFAENHRIITVMMHAQYYLIDYYRSLGFTEEGNPFYEAEIKHITMTCRLSD